jgi:hypothetical protein
VSYTRYFHYILEGTDPVQKIRDMETLGYGLNLFYALGEGKYSLAAAMDQSDLQLESGGAWLLFAAWRQQLISNQGPLVPAAFQADFGSEALTFLMDNTTITAGPGYGYLWSKGEFFASGSLSMGPGYRRSYYKLTTGENKTDTSVGFNALVRLAAGLNGRKGLVTLSFYYDEFNYQTRSFTVANSVYGGILSGALRF